MLELTIMYDLIVKIPELGFVFESYFTITMSNFSYYLPLECVQNRYVSTNYNALKHNIFGKAFLSHIVKLFSDLTMSWLGIIIQFI